MDSFSSKTQFSCCSLDILASRASFSCVRSCGESSENCSLLMPLLKLKVVQYYQDTRSYKYIIAPVVLPL